MLNLHSDESVKKMEFQDPDITPTNRNASAIESSDTSRLVKDNSMLAMGKNSDFRLNKNVDDAPETKMHNGSAMSADQ